MANPSAAGSSLIGRRTVLQVGAALAAAGPALMPERLTGALLDRLTHHVHILEMNGDSYRLKQSKRRQRQPQAPELSDNQPQA